MGLVSQFPLKEMQEIRNTVTDLCIIIIIIITDQRLLQDMTVCLQASF